MKTQTKWIVGGVAAVGVLGTVIYLATRPKASASVTTTAPPAPLPPPAANVPAANVPAQTSAQVAQQQQQQQQQQQNQPPPPQQLQQLANVSKNFNVFQ